MGEYDIIGLPGSPLAVGADVGAIVVPVADVGTPVAGGDVDVFDSKFAGAWLGPSCDGDTVGTSVVLLPLSPTPSLPAGAEVEVPIEPSTKVGAGDAGTGGNVGAGIFVACSVGEKEESSPVEPALGVGL